MSKKLKIFIGVVIFIVVGYGIGCVVFMNTLNPNTKMYQSSLVPFNEKELKKFFDEKELVLIVPDKREKVSIPLKDIEYTIVNADTLGKDMLSKQNAFAWPYTLIASQNIDCAQIDPDENSLKKVIKKEVVKNKGLKKSKSAYFDLTSDDKAKVIAEVVGEQLDDKLVYDKITNSLKAGDISINLKDAIIKPTIVANELEKTIDEVDFKIANTIDIKVEGVNYTIKPTKKDKLGWLNVDYKNNSVTIEKKAILNYLKHINNEFINKGKKNSTIYRVNNGVSTLVQQGEPVLGIDEYETSAIIYNAMKNNKNVNQSIKAVSVSKPQITYEGISSIDNNLVEVSIAKQKVYLYKDGKLILSADTVTGKPNGDTDTPKGKFKVMYKTTNFVLKGADYGYDYKLPVSFWIPLENGGGVGLHDAPWRAANSFGGSLYLNDGSHGCINMKYKDVKVIYDNVVAGTAVWIH